MAVLGFIALKLVVSRTYGPWRRECEEKTAKLATDLEEFHRPGRPVSATKVSFEREREQLKKRLEEVKQELEVPFPDWTGVPEGKEKESGSYFLAKHSTIRTNLATLCSSRKVDLLVPNVGFPPEKFGGELDKDKAETNLRKLYIVERLIDLLSLARVKKIIEVTPDEPKKEGAVRFERNPRYDGRNASSQEFIVHRYPPFIWEYPVEIEVVCGVDALMNFLHSVRQRKQFLTIRAINVVSEDAYEAAGEKIASWKEAESRQLQVTISAAGMSFISDEARKGELDKFEETRPRRPVPKKGSAKPIGI